MMTEGLSGAAEEAGDLEPHLPLHQALAKRSICETDISTESRRQ